MAHKNLFRRVVGAMLGLTIVGSGAPAWAAEILVYPDAGPTRYYGSIDDLMFCAKRPTDIPCAVDAWDRCRFVGGEAACDAIGIRSQVYRPHLYEHKTVKASRKYAYAFRPVKKVTVDASDFANSSHMAEWLRPGDVEVTYQFGADCTPDDPTNCSWEIIGQEYLFLRKVGEYWTLVGWNAEAGDIVCEESAPPYDAECRFYLPDYLYIDYVQTVDPTRDTGVKGFKRIDPAPHMNE